jgi:hypothetical protein
MNIVWGTEGMAYLNGLFQTRLTRFKELGIVYEDEIILYFVPLQPEGIRKIHDQGGTIKACIGYGSIHETDSLQLPYLKVCVADGPDRLEESCYKLKYCIPSLYDRYIPELEPGILVEVGCEGSGIKVIDRFEQCKYVFLFHVYCNF